MRNRLSVIMVTRNAQELLARSLQSVKKLSNEIIIVDAGSQDNTKEIARQFGAKIFTVKKNHLGRNKAKALSKANGSWILLLDSDEIVGKALQKEIKSIIRKKPVHDGYIIPFRNHYLRRFIKHGGENYAMLRLIRRNKAEVKNLSVHEFMVLRSDNFVKLRSPIFHYSYRSIVQMYKKFTIYALSEATEKYKKGEASSLKKIVLYPIHMFWARFIKDKGYKDGMYRIPLDLGFAYMEFLTYVSLAIKKPR